MYNPYHCIEQCLYYVITGSRNFRYDIQMENLDYLNSCIDSFSSSDEY